MRTNDYFEFIETEAREEEYQESIANRERFSPALENHFSDCFCHGEWAKQCCSEFNRGAEILYCTRPDGHDGPHHCCRTLTWGN